MGRRAQVNHKYGIIQPVEQYAGLLDLAKRLLARLGRLSVDSSWARRASGVRGALIKAIDALESAGEDAPQRAAELESLVRFGYAMLEKAAREIKPPS
jgi:hypothetical protein